MLSREEIDAVTIIAKFDDKSEAKTPSSEQDILVDNSAALLFLESQSLVVRNHAYLLAAEKNMLRLCALLQITKANNKAADEILKSNPHNMTTITKMVHQIQSELSIKELRSAAVNVTQLNGISEAKDTVDIHSEARKLMDKLIKETAGKSIEELSKLALSMLTFLDTRSLPIRNLAYLQAAGDGHMNICALLLASGAVNQTAEDILGKNLELAKIREIQNALRIAITDKFHIECAIDHELMTDAVILHVGNNDNGHSYERKNAIGWLAITRDDPFTHAPVLTVPGYYPNITLQKFISELVLLSDNEYIPILQLQERLKPLEKHFLCPIMHKPMRQPVVASDGYTYEQEALTAYLDRYDDPISPCVARTTLSQDIHITNFTLIKNQRVLRELCKTESKEELIPAEKLDALVHLARANARILNNEKDAAALSNRGLAFDALGNHKEALVNYDASLALRPDHADTLYNRAITLAKLNQYDEALVSVNASLKVLPKDAMSLSLQGSIFVCLELYNEALVSLEASLEVSPNHANTVCNKVVCLQHLQRYEQALTSIKAAVTAGQNEADFYSYLGDTFLRLLLYKEALENYDAAFKLDSGNVNTLINRGYIFNRLGLYNEALESTEAALGLSPNNVLALSNRGFYLAILGRFEVALTSIDAALAINPKHKTAVFTRAVILTQLARFTEAYTSYKLFHAIADPEFDAEHSPSARVKLLILRHNISDVARNPMTLFGESNTNLNEEKSLPTSMQNSLRGGRHP